MPHRDATRNFEDRRLRKYLGHCREFHRADKVGVVILLFRNNLIVFGKLSIVGCKPAALCRCQYNTTGMSQPFNESPYIYFCFNRGLKRYKKTL